jgi:hypothetical protein
MPKLTLRDLFAVVTIVALALGWWVDHRRMEQAQLEAMAERDELIADREQRIAELEQGLAKLEADADVLRDYTDKWVKAYIVTKAGGLLVPPAPPPGAR